MRAERCKGLRAIGTIWKEELLAGAGMKRHGRPSEPPLVFSYYFLGAAIQLAFFDRDAFYLVSHGGSVRALRINPLQVV